MTCLPQFQAAVCGKRRCRKDISHTGAVALCPSETASQRARALERSHTAEPTLLASGAVLVEECQANHESCCQVSG